MKNDLSRSITYIIFFLLVAVATSVVTAVHIEPDTVFKVKNTTFLVDRPMDFYQIIIGDDFIVFDNMNYSVATNETRTIIIGEPIEMEPSIIQVESKTVTVNQSFVLNISCHPTQPIKGWELKISFDQRILVVNSVTMGDFFDGYQQFPVTGIINNTDGTVINIYNLIVGKTGNVSMDGRLCIINLTALIEGQSDIRLYDAGVCNETMYVPLNTENGNVIVIAEKNDTLPPQNDTIPPLPEQNDTISPPPDEDNRPGNLTGNETEPGDKPNPLGTFATSIVILFLVYMVLMVLSSRKK